MALVVFAWVAHVLLAGVAFLGAFAAGMGDVGDGDWAYALRHSLGLVMLMLLVMTALTVATFRGSRPRVLVTFLAGHAGLAAYFAVRASYGSGANEAILALLVIDCLALAAVLLRSKPIQDGWRASRPVLRIIGVGAALAPIVAFLVVMATLASQDVPLP
jgi:hypothetical protein